MPQNFLFQSSLLLAIAGIASAVSGIVVEQFKPILLGFVLICGAGVFATLYAGTRWGSQKAEQSESHECR